MKFLFGKIRKEKSGFTLIEMLITVALIAILVAISIPLVTECLRKARISADQHNLRAAQSAFYIKYMGNGKDGKVKDLEALATDGDISHIYVFDRTANLIGKPEDFPAYSLEPYGKCSIHNGKIVSLKIVGPDSNGDYVLQAGWDVPSGGSWGMDPCE